jgi:tRNA(Arg) A34 adenosine deaminase TadA
MNQDSKWMAYALELANQAGQSGEVPVGAVVVREGVVVGRGRNGPVGNIDPTAHAELLALRDAAQHIGNYRLEDCTLYVTLEPCTMCAGAILNSRISRLVFGASEPKTGAAGSVHNVFLNSSINHQTQVLGGVMAEESKQLLQQFFKPKRMNLNPLREDALRPLDEWFEGIPDYPWHANYLSDLPTLNGLRMHYLDESEHAEKKRSANLFVFAWKSCLELSLQKDDAYFFGQWPSRCGARSHWFWKKRQAQKITSTQLRLPSPSFMGVHRKIELGKSGLGGSRLGGDIRSHFTHGNAKSICGLAGDEHRLNNGRSVLVRRVFKLARMVQRQSGL